MQNNNFKKLVTYLLTMIVITSCNQPDRSQEATLKPDEALNNKQDSVNTKAAKSDTVIVSNELEFLRKLKGKYPQEIKLFDHPVLKKRLQEMLGSQYGYLKSIWQVETPVEISDTFFYTWGMQAHSGGDPGAVLMADLINNTLFAGIRKDRSVKMYSEDSSKMPQRLKAWSKEALK